MGLLLALRSGVPLLPHAGAQPAKSRTLQFIERHVGQRIVIRAATMMWTARRERGREGACGDWVGAAFWTEFTRRGQPSGNCSVPQYKRRLERRGENGESG